MNQDLTSLIPASNIEAVLRAINEAFPHWTVNALVPVLGGASSALIFRLSFDAGDFLLRIDVERDALKDPRRQYTCLAIAAEAGVAPQLYYANAEDGVSITAFIDKSEGPDGAVRLAAIAHALRELHAAELFPRLVDFVDGVGLILEQLKATTVLCPEDEATLAGLYEDCVEAYPHYEVELVSSHNDLNPTNVLFEGDRVWFVDWETAFAADRFVDLAAIANFTGMDTAQPLLCAYLGGEPSQQQRDHFTLMRQISRIFYISVLLNAAAMERPGFRLAAGELDGLRYAQEANSVAGFEAKLGLVGTLFSAAALVAVDPDFEEVKSRLISKSV